MKKGTENSFEGFEEIENPIVRNIVMQEMPSLTDPFGSWTGKPVDEDEIPLQDADDL